jgi:hypothetical protein
LGVSAASLKPIGFLISENMRTKAEKYSNEIPDSINCSPESNFTPIPNDIIRNPNISSKAKTILFILLSNQIGWCSHIQTILGMIKEGVATVNVSLQELEQLGYLKRVQYRDRRTKARAGSFWAYSNIPYDLDYSKNISIIETKGFELYPEKLNVEKLNVEKLNVEKLNVEKLNVEKLNVEKLNVENKGLIILNNNNTKKKENQDIKKTKEKDISVPLANFLQKIIEEKKNIHITPMQIEKWARDISKLIKTNQVSYERIRTALRWYKEHCRDEYCPVIESGASLREKFMKLEAAMEREQNPFKEKERPSPNTNGFRSPTMQYREADRHM